jgi:hypothetical protein
LKTLLLTATFTAIAAFAWAHVPYIEHNDFSDQQPFTVEYSIEQSLAVYACLENNDLGYSKILMFLFSGSMNQRMSTWKFSYPFAKVMKNFYHGLLWSVLDYPNPKRRYLSISRQIPES